MSLQIVSCLLHPQNLLFVILNQYLDNIKDFGRVAKYQNVNQKTIIKVTRIAIPAIVLILKNQFDTPLYLLSAFLLFLRQFIPIKSTQEHKLLKHIL